MTPEAECYLTKARLTLDHARTMLTVNLTEDAGRAAYLAGYQAAGACLGGEKRQRLSAPAYAASAAMRPFSLS